MKVFLNSTYLDLIEHRKAALLRGSALLALIFSLLTACATPTPTITPAPSLTPTATETAQPTKTPTAIATAMPTPSPYESLVNADPSSLTIELFLNAMPADIKAIHENPSAATQEQKDAHDKWITDAWKAIFNNLTDAQLSQMNLKRTDIAALGFGLTGETYEEYGLNEHNSVVPKQFPAYDDSLFQAIMAFSQEFYFSEPSLMLNFWEALKAKQGADWSKYLDYYEQHQRTNWQEYSFEYAVDGTAIHDVPIPGLEGVVADLAVRAYYYDANGDPQTILVAMVIRLPDGTLVKTSSLNQIKSQAEIDQIIKDYPGSFQIGEPGSLPETYFMTEENLIKMCGEECRAFPGVQAYFQFVKANQTALDEFLKTGSPALKIIFLARNSLGGSNIFHENFSNQPPTP